VLLESPTLSPEQRAKLEEAVRGPSLPDDMPAVDIDRIDVTCPGVAEAKGEMPPNGFERWCEREDGTRHGPALRWNEDGERIREVEYRDGAAILVTFTLPDSQQLSPEAFMCSSDRIERREGSGNSERRWCETESGVRSGPEVAWEGGRVVSVTSYEAGEVVQWNIAGPKSPSR
jgi:hypothetical protein